MKPKIGKFMIATGEDITKVDRWVEVTGKIIGCAGVHFDGFWWKVTHIPTGRLALGPFMDEEHALLFSGAINHILKDIHLSNDDYKGMMDALSPCKAKIEKYMEYIENGGEKQFKEWDFIRTTEENS